MATIGVPEGAAARTQWVKELRIAHLTFEHLRAMHIRLLRTYSMEGYSDLEWWPDLDLQILVSHGEGQIARLKNEIASSERDLAFPGKQKREEKGRADKLKKKQAELSALSKKIQPYIDEAKRRQVRPEAQ